MFLCSVRMSKIKLFIIFLVILAIGIVSVFVLSSMHSGDQAPGQMPAEEMMMVETNEQRVAFLEYFGWKVIEEPTDACEVLIPNEFDDVFTNYNKIQLDQGLDLGNCKGQTAIRYTYLVTNYPDGSANVYAHILVIENRVVGGDVSSSELDGFMHGFLMP